MALLIIIDYYNTFTGSRQWSGDETDITNEMVAFLEEEFPGTPFDEALLVKDDSVITQRTITDAEENKSWA